jgi:hypothetical protein
VEETGSGTRVFAAVGIIAVVFGALGAWTNRTLPKPALGVTFSTTYARSLGEDPNAVFLALLDDLRVREFRVPLYWSDIEKSPGQFDWSAYDQLVNEADARGAKLTLAVGAKVPRWPECYIPDWAETQDGVQFESSLLAFVEAAVRRYDGHPSVVQWQVENEALFPFGVCPPPSIPRLLDELKLVRSLSTKPIQMTSSGELESWPLVAWPADVLGVSLYRTTWNDLWGYARYPMPPVFYAVRAFLVSPLVKRVTISELQAEPWFFTSLKAQPLSTWIAAFPPSAMADNYQFALETGLPDVSLWGAEWWYYLKQNGHPELWEEARALFAK